MPLSPLSESESPLHNNTNGDTFINPFEISDDISSTNPNITIEPDDASLSTDNKSQPKAKSQTPKATATINVEQTKHPFQDQLVNKPDLMLAILSMSQFR